VYYSVLAWAEVCSGLTDEEILEVDAFVRNTTTEKFGRCAQ
jgi:hypothetical protein